MTKTNDTSFNNKTSESALPVIAKTSQPRLSLAKPIPKPDQILNLYQPYSPSTLNSRKPMHLYDINFVLPFKVLSTGYVRLEPLVPSKHLEGFLSLPDLSWDVFGGLGPYDEESALIDIEDFRAEPSSLLLAVVDEQAERRGENGFAGVYGLTEASDEEMSMIFGLINILPKYQKTHINTHAMFLILSYMFEEIGMVRVQYDAVTFNKGSIATALRFGFREEGICRNMGGLVPKHKRRQGEETRGSQDLWCSSMTNQEWKCEGKDRFVKLMTREPVDTSTL
ncbi:hypothetical protein P7C73_g2086, partial [Tremellales sp. Uapishka_1]